MATQASVRLAGRFAPGTDVKLVEVDSAATLRAEGGREIGSKRVGEDGTVTFSNGVRVGGRYFIVGYVAGSPLEVRIRGNAADDPVNAQAPVGPDRVRLSDGSFVDEPPAQHQKAGSFPPGPALGQHQVPKGTVQRSDTPRGTAHPVDVKDREPVRAQEDVPKGIVQMSDTPGRIEEATGREISGGEATEIVVGPQRQEDVPKGVLQRSDTPTGVAVPVPVGDPVEATRLAESSRARESRGDRTRAMAEPLKAKGIRAGAVTGSSQKDSEKRDADLKRSEREAAAVGGVPAGTATGPDQPGVEHEDRSGFDAQGQPAAADVARAAGLDAPEKARVDAPGPDTAPSVRDRGKQESGADTRKRTGLTAAQRSERSKKAAATRKRNAASKTSGQEPATTTANKTKE